MNNLDENMKCSFLNYIFTLERFMSGISFTTIFLVIMKIFRITFIKITFLFFGLNVKELWNESYIKCIKRLH